MGKARTDKKLRKLVRAAAAKRAKTERTVPMTKSHWGNWTHISFRFSRGDAPIGLGFRVFLWKPESEFVFSVDILFFAFDLQFGIHV